MPETVLTAGVETWSPVVGFEGKYEVSDMGRVKTVFRAYRSHYRPGHVLKPYHNGVRGGHLKVQLRSALGVRVRCYVHVLVLTAFSGKPAPGLFCLHGDGNPTNNCLTNLRWGTQRENLEDARRHGTLAQGNRLPQTKLTVEKVAEVKRRLAAGDRICRIAEAAGISPTVIHAIRKKKTWKHVPDAS